MADDLDVAATEQLLRAGKLPNIQRQLVDTGTTFVNSFVTYALCCPSRATFLTGQYTHNHKVFSNLLTSRPEGSGSFQSFRSPDQERNTLPAWLDAAGYRTAHVGKYLNGYTDSRHVPIGWDEWQTLLDYSTYLMRDYRIVERLSPTVVTPTVTQPITTYQTYELATRAASFITRTHQADPRQPLFLMVAPLAPHIEGDSPRTVFQANTYTDTWTWGITPPPEVSGTLRAGFSGILTPTDRVNRPDLPRPGFDLPTFGRPHFNEQDVSDKPTWLREDGIKPGLAGWPLMTITDTAYLRRQHLDRLESLIGIDTLVGRVTRALSETGKLTNTLLIFTSDNGYHLGEHRLNEKFAPYEESIRVPLFVRAPGQTVPRVEERFVINTDLSATIDDYAGTTPAGGFQIDGRSLRPLLEGAPPSLPWRKRFLVEYWFPSRDRVSFWDLPDYAALRSAPGDEPTSNQLYVEYDTDDEPVTDDGRTTDVEHYLLDSDPYLLTSRHNEPALDPLRGLLSAQLNSLRECQGTATDEPLKLSCKEAEDLPDSFWGGCSVVDAAFSRPLYDRTTNVTGQRQVVFGAGAFWVRDASSPAANTWSDWTRYSLYNAWKDDINAPPLSHVDAAAFLPLASATGSITSTRQLIYSGDRVWSRDSTDRLGATWPLTWTSTPLTTTWGSAGAQGSPPASRIDAVAFTQVYSPDGEQAAIRQLVYAGDRLWSRDSDDRYGREWTTNWVSTTLFAEWGLHANPRPPIDRIDAVDIIPIRRSGELVALQQLIYARNAVWSRESVDPALDFTTVTTWTVATYAQSWEQETEGGWYARPPVECTPLNLQDDTLIVVEDTPLLLPILGNDSYRVLTHTLNISAELSASLSQTLTLSDVVTTGLSGTLSLLPTGQLIYTPALNMVGSEVFSYTLADRDGHVSTAWATLIVTPANDVPTFFTDIPAQQATLGEPYTTTITATDIDAGDALTITATLLPTWLTLSATNDLTSTNALSTSIPISATAILSGTADRAGEYPVELQVTDSAGASALQRFSISVPPEPLYLPLFVRS